MSVKRLPIGVILGAVFASITVLYWWLNFAFSDSESETDETIVLSILVVYILYLIKYFVANEGRRYTVSAFSISATVSSFAWGYYDSQVGGWFWNDDWILEDALLASIRPPIILMLINEVTGMIIRVFNETTSVRQNHPTSMIRIGLVASLPLCVAAPLGVFMLIPTLAIFFIFYRASTDTPSILIGH